MATHVFIAGARVNLLSSVSIKRSASNPICTATFQTPIDFLTEANARASVEIYKDGVTYFLGIITSYSLSYAGKVISLQLTCSDLAYKLAHSLIPLTATEAATLTYGESATAAMIDRLTFFWDGPVDSRTYVYAGNAVEALLTGTGLTYEAYDYYSSPATRIDYIGFRDVQIPESLYVFEPGKTRLDAIKAWADALGAIFYVKFVGKDSIFVFDTYTNLVASTTNLDFNTTVAVSDSTHLVKSFNLVSVPENIYTRCTEEINDFPTTEDWFEDETERDAYYTAHPTELVEGLFIHIGAGDDDYIQLYTDSAWIDYPIHAEAVSTGETATYYDKYIEIDRESGTVLADDVAVQLSNYELVDSRASIELVGAAIELYNIVDLTGLYSDMGISVDTTSWRLAETDISVSPGSIITKASIVNATIPRISDKTTCGTYTLPELVKKATETAIDKAADRVGTVDNINLDDKIVTVKYPGGEKQAFKIGGKTKTLPEGAYNPGDLVSVPKLFGGNKTIIPIFTQDLPLVAGDAVFAGGYTTTYSDTIDTISIATLANATDFGNLTVARQSIAACSSSTRGIFGGGYIGSSYVNNIDYISFSAAGNATDFGDLTDPRSEAAGCSSSTRGVFGGGYNRTNIIDYVTIASAGNATDFGDLTIAREYLGACSSPTIGVFAGGHVVDLLNTIDYITIASAGNATDFGDLTVGRYGLAGCSSSTRGLFGGGFTSATVNTIDYVTIASVGNATDFGDLTVARDYLGACSSPTRGVFAGGYTGTALNNTIDYVTIASAGNATDFGDMFQSRETQAGCSTSHGGIA